MSFISFITEKFSFNKTKNKEEQQDLVGKLPLDLQVKILGFLEKFDLFNVMLTCKAWKDMARHPSLWQRECQAIGLTQNPSYAQIAPSIKVIKERAAAGEALLKKEVKTAFNFDHAFLRLRNSNLGSDALGAAMENLENEMIEKLDDHKKLSEGFKAECALYKLGLRKLSDLESYATSLERKYGDTKAWGAIVAFHIHRKNYEEAFKIIDKVFAREYEKGRFIGQIARDYCENKKFDEAIDLLKKYEKDKYAETTETQDALNTIFAYASEEKNLRVLERAIDEFPNNYMRNIQIKNLIETYIEDHQYEKAIGLVKKYKKIFDEAEDYEVHSLLPLYVRLNLIEEAWKMAEKNKNDKLIYYVLRNAFLDCNMQEEANKAIAIIEKLPKEEEKSALKESSDSNSEFDFDIQQMLVRMRESLNSQQ